MTPRALVLHYSQTGQTSAAAAALVGPLEAAGWTVEWRPLEVEESYPFPWSPRGFLDAFPETVLGLPPPLRPLALDREDLPDLIVLASQVWYLAPSLPVQAFLESADRSVLAGRPVLAVVTCRNMWYAAVIRLEQRLRRAGAELLGTVVLTDKSPRWTTFVMTPRLFLTGRRNRLWGVVPAPGIGAGELRRATRIGEKLAVGLEPIEPLTGPVPAVEIVPENLVLDNFASRAFPFFARPIRGLGRVGGRRARAGGIWAFAACLVLGVVASLPLLGIGRVLLGGRMRAAASRYGERLEGESALAPPPPAARRPVDLGRAVRSFVDSDLLDGEAGEVTDTTPLLELGIVDSVSIVALVAFIEDELGIPVPEEEIHPRHLADILSIQRLIVSLDLARRHGPTH